MTTTILKYAFALLLIVLIGCASQAELSTNLQEWEDCRSEAWIKCFGENESFIDIFNMLCSDYDVLNVSQCRVLNDINTNCWIAQFDLCDLQFDMQSIDEQLSEG